MDKTQAAKLLGKLGGSVTSEAKALAAKKNGQKGGRPRTQKPQDTPLPILAPTLQIINSLIDKELIKSYAIGGSLSIMYYTEPFFTSDLDIFCHVESNSTLFQLGPIWQYLKKLGCKSHDLYISINGIDVQFISPGPKNILEVEAMKTAVPIKVEGVPTHIFELEYAIAIKVNAGRHKDWGHIYIAMESAEVDMTKLKALLKKFGLLTKWKQHYENTQ